MVTKTVYKQIRAFVIAWLAITVFMVMATFLAIYFNYSAVDIALSSSNPLPLSSPEAESDNEAETALAPPSASPAPTQKPTFVTPSPVMPVFLEHPTPAPAPTDTPAPTPIPTPLPVDDKTFAVGIQVQHSPDFNQEYQAGWYRSVSSDLGLRWIKQQARWGQIESEPGKIDWTILDFIMPSAAEFDLKLMLSIVEAPDWAREPGVDLGKRGPPADPNAFANFAAEIVKRYPGRVHAIEVWQDQNTDLEWTSSHGLSAEKYVELLRVARAAIKAIDPGVIVISGALTPTGLNDGVGAFDDFVYLDRLIAGGLLEWADCVGARHSGYNVSPDHRYNEIPADEDAAFRGPFDNPHHSWSFRSTLEGYIDRIRAAGADTRLCVTEFGWASAEDLDGAREGFAFARDNSLAEQAEWIAKAMSNMRDWGFVWLAFIWNFNHAPQAGYALGNDSVPYSLIGPGFTFRPAYDSIRDWQRAYLDRSDA